MQQSKSCPNIDVNLRNCGCTYSSCERKGRCCECIRFHRKRSELPGCLFSPEVEETYERSVKNFMQSRR